MRRCAALLLMMSWVVAGAQPYPEKLGSASTPPGGLLPAGGGAFDMLHWDGGSAWVLVDDAAAGTILDEAVTVTNPSVVANRADADTGLCWPGADVLGLCAGGVSGVEITESGAAITLVDILGPFRAGGALTTPDATVDSTIVPSATTQTPLAIQGLAGQTANLMEWQTSAGSIVASIDKNGAFTSSSSVTGTLFRSTLYAEITGATPLFINANRVAIARDGLWYEGDGANADGDGLFIDWKSDFDILDTGAGDQGTVTANVLADFGQASGTDITVNWGGITAVSWTNAEVAALGAVAQGQVVAFTLPAKTHIEQIWVIIDSPETALADLTVSCGVTGADYVDMIVDSDGQAAANTVYGDIAAERGGDLTGYLPDVTGAATLNLDFETTDGGGLVGSTGSTGTIYIKANRLP